MTLLEVLDGLLGDAVRAGADAADAVAFDSTSLSAAWRMGELESLERSESRAVGLRVLVGRRQAAVSSTDPAEATLREVVERAVAMARAAPEDPYCGLAGPDQLVGDDVGLDIWDGAEPAGDVLMDDARAAEDAARAVSGVTNSEGASAGWGHTGVAVAATNGLARSYSVSSNSIGASVLAGEGLEMERDYEFTTAVHRSDLDDPEKVGREAGERAVRRLGARKVSSQQVPVVYDPRVSATLVRHFARGINGAAIRRGTSFLRNAMGERVFPRGVSIIDDPHRPRGLRSRPFDGEGLPGARRALADDGVLESWILDLASSRQLELSSTGHASRGTASPPFPSATNIYMERGAVSPEGLIADIDAGFYVTELIGMGVNIVTGDYSRGAAGFWIENGEIAYPVSEVTIAGDLRSMFAALTPADDLVFRYGADAPTIRVDGMTVGGE